MAERTISLPFRVTPYGSVGSTSEQSKIWSDRVRSVLGTAIRERVMNPGFGTLIPYALFENESKAEAEIEVEVRKAFGRFLPLLTLDTVSVFIDNYSNVMTIDVTYDLPNNETVNTLVGIVSLNCAAPSVEVDL